MTPSKIDYAHHWNLTWKVGLQQVFFSAKIHWGPFETRVNFSKSTSFFWKRLISETKFVTPNFFCITDKCDSLSECSKSIEKICVLEHFRTNVLKRWIRIQRDSNPPLRDTATLLYQLIKMKLHRPVGRATWQLWEVHGSS